MSNPSCWRNRSKGHLLNFLPSMLSIKSNFCFDLQAREYIAEKSSIDTNDSTDNRPAVVEKSPTGEYENPAFQTSASLVRICTLTGLA